MGTITVLDSTGATQTIQEPLPPGQTTMGNSRPVAIASDQSAIPVTVAQLPTSLGIQLSAASLPVTLPSDASYVVATGTSADAEYSGTGSGTVISLLKWIGAGIASLLGVLPASLGTKTMSASLPVTLASDGPVVVATGTTADVAWAGTGNSTIISALKAIASAALDTTTDSPVAPHQPSALVTFTPTLSTSAYAAGNVLFATAPISLMRANGLRAALMSMTVVDKTKQTPAFTIFFYQSNVTSAAVNTANNLSDSDALSYIGHLSVAAGDYKTLANNSFAVYKSINLLLQAASGTTNVYAVGVLDAGTPTFALGDLQLGFGVVQS